jgi:hypothetical protein
VSGVRAHTHVWVGSRMALSSPPRMQPTQAPLSMSLIYEEPSGKRRSLDLVCQVNSLLYVCALVGFEERGTALRFRSKPSPALSSTCDI